MSTVTRELRPAQNADNSALPEETAPLLVSVEEAARLLSISTRTVYRLIADASLPFIKLGRRTLVSVASLENWVADQEVAVPLAVYDGVDPDHLDAEIEDWALRVLNKVDVFTSEVNTLAKKRPGIERPSETDADDTGLVEVRGHSPRQRGDLHRIRGPESRSPTVRALAESL